MQEVRYFVQFSCIALCPLLPMQGLTELIICESLQILENAQQVGINCMTLNLENLLTTESVYEFVAIQWSIYTSLLVYQWSSYGLKKVKL